MSVKAIISHDSPQIWMTRKENSKKIVNLPLIPIRAIVQARNAGYRLGLVRISLDPDAAVMPHGQKVVYNLKSRTFSRVVDRGDVGDLCIFGCGVELEESHDGDDALRRDVNGELIFPDGELLNVGGKCGEKVLAVGMERGSFRGVFIGWIYDGGVEFTASYEK